MGEGHEQSSTRRPTPGQAMANRDWLVEEMCFEWCRALGAYLHPLSGTVVKRCVVAGCFGRKFRNSVFLRVAQTLAGRGFHFLP